MSTIDRPAPQESTFADPPRPDVESTDPSQVERIIKPSRGWIAVDWRELYQSRELFDTLIFRDIKVRYKQTVLGVAWAVVQPLVSMVVFTLIFGNFPGMRDVGVPYALFLFCGQVPWTFFTNAATSAGMSLLGQQQLLSKVYFPRLYVPASTAGAYLVDMAIGLALFGLLMPYFHFTPSANIIFLPLVIFMTFAAALGLGLVMAAMTIMFRDLRFIIPFMMQLLMFASPIIYPPTMLSPRLQQVVALNPMTGVITAYRWCILGMPLNISSLLISIVATVFVLVFGLFFFRKSERFFADLL